MRDYYFKAKELLAKRSLKKGDEILRADPFAYVIDVAHAGQYCDHCLIPSRKKVLKGCNGCDVVWYCSENCAFMAQDIHQHECRPLKRFQPSVPSSFARLLLRTIIRLKMLDGENTSENYCAKKGRKFKDLMNHYTDIRKDSNRMEDVRLMRSILEKLIGPKNVPPESDFIGLYGRLIVNRFCLMDDQMSPIGSAVYLAASIFDHSCVPNAYASFEGKSVVIRTLVDWPELNLNKVFISYLDILHSTFYRKMELRMNWYFWCDCPLCKDEERIALENGINCGNKDCKNLMIMPDTPEAPYSDHGGALPKCHKCGWQMSKEDMDKYHAAVSYTRTRLKILREDQPAFQLCLAVLENQGDIFPPMNVWRVKALDCAFNSAHFYSAYSKALEYGRSNIDAMRRYYGPNHPTLGMFLMKFGKVLLYMKEYREGLKIVEEAEEILKVCLGPNHSLVTDKIKNLKIVAYEDPEIYAQNFYEEKMKKEHELVCKHCGRRKNKIQRPDIKPPEIENGYAGHEREEPTI